MSNRANRGNHYAPAAGRVVKKRPVALVVASVALALGLVGGTIAYIVAQTGDVKNTFEPGSVEVSILENFKPNGIEKTDVKFQNDGNVDAFIRATIVVNWVDGDGNYIPISADSEYSYSISYDDTGAWKQLGDGYWYHKASVPAEGDYDETAVLVKSCSPISSPEDCFLKVDVIVDAIQAEGTFNGSPVATEVWGVPVASDDSGKLYLNI